MSWFGILLIIIAYLVIGGMVMTIAEKLDIPEFELDCLPPIVIVIFWPLFMVAGLVILIVFGSAALGGWLMEQIIKWFKGEKKEEEKK